MSIPSDPSTWQTGLCHDEVRALPIGLPDLVPLTFDRANPARMRSRIIALSHSAKIPAI
jgi:hypothetical protein